MAGREIPSVPAGLDAQTRNFLSAVREAVNQVTINGAGGTGAGGTSTAGVTGASTGTGTGTGGTPNNLVNTTIPPKPTGLSAVGIFSSVMVTWSKPNYLNHSFAEVWRANAVDSKNVLIPATGENANGNSISFVRDAHLAGTSNGNLYSDPVSPGSQHYYWVRFISTSNVAGPYAPDTGLLGSTVQDINALMIANGWTLEVDKIMDGLLKTRHIDDFAVTNAKIKNLAIDNAKMGLLSVDTAQIRDLAVTSAKIESLGVEKLVATKAWIETADILDGNITNAKIGNTIESDNYNGSTLGWHLSKDGGNVNLNQLTVRDAAGRIILSSNAGIPLEAINGKITKANVDTYLSSACISNLYIGQDAVTVSGYVKVPYEGGQASLTMWLDDGVRALIRCSALSRIDRSGRRGEQTQAISIYVGKEANSNLLFRGTLLEGNDEGLIVTTSRSVTYAVSGSGWYVINSVIAGLQWWESAIEVMGVRT